MQFLFILFAQASKTKMKKKTSFYVTMTTTMLQILIWTLHNILFNTAILKPCIFVSLLRDDDNWKYFRVSPVFDVFFKYKICNEELYFLELLLDFSHIRNVGWYLALHILLFHFLRFIIDIVTFCLKILILMILKMLKI